MTAFNPYAFYKNKKLGDLTLADNSPNVSMTTFSMIS